MRKLFYAIMIVLGYTQLYACNTNKEIDTFKDQNDPLSADMQVSKQDTMKLRMTIGSKTATAVLYNNPTSRDFATLLPLTVKMDDYSNTEKIFYPSRKLSSSDAPAGFDPSIGDITLYAPWGNVALFYKDFGYSNGLISLGKITGGMEAFMVKGSITVKFELEK